MTKMRVHEAGAIVLSCEAGDKLRRKAMRADLSQMVFPFHRSGLMNHFVEI